MNIKAYIEDENDPLTKIYKLKKILIFFGQSPILVPQVCSKFRFGPSTFQNVPPLVPDSFTLFAIEKLDGKEPETNSEMFQKVEGPKQKEKIFRDQNRILSKHEGSKRKKKI